MFSKLVLFFKGYLIISLKETVKERFFNLCKAKEIEIIDTIMINQSIYCKMKLKDYWKIRPVVKKTKCLPRIEKKRGFPFVCRKMLKRKGIMLGCFFGVFILWQMTQRIWYTQVQGGFVHTREQILTTLENEMKIFGGTNKYIVNCKDIETKIRLIYPQIGWVSVEKRGCNLYIRLNESSMPQTETGPENSSHIIAERSGIVKRIEVLSGIATVKEGDVVQKGDLLISGIVPVVGDYDELIYNNPVGAKGKVWIETELLYQKTGSLLYEKKIEKGQKTGCEIFWDQRKIFSYIPRYSGVKYDIMEYDIVPFCFRDYQAPLRVRFYELTAYETEPKQWIKEEAKQMAETEFSLFLEDLKMQGIHVMNSEVSVECIGTSYRLTGTGIICGNFISYQEIEQEELIKQDEYSGNHS
ncbi:MAG: hypothetical protein E7260_01655 [Lachnospiraceae bacterium]|nr:hypothetical protein [Lachnospiraceae bacterium]